VTGIAATAGTVLVVNCGSSSVKYRLLEPDDGRVLATGLADRVGRDGSTLRHECDGGVHRLTGDLPTHGDALMAIMNAFREFGPDVDTARLLAAGHRVVHGGRRFVSPTIVDDTVLATIDELAVLAPLHNPANAEGIRVARRVLPGIPHVAVFDTAFHATIPPRAATYAVPREWREEYGVRRYGFHGSSHAYVSRTAAGLLARPLEEVDVVVLHLGNGASACAVSGGRSIDTSMGLTPLPGLVMGTRSGDVDPALPAHLSRVAGLTGQQVDDALNSRSGLLALAGVADMREVTARAAAGDRDADLALDVFAYRVRCYIGAYLAAMGGLHAVAFTGGIGENSAVVRARCLAGLEALGIAVDAGRNEAAAPPRPPGAVISPDGCAVTVLAVPTDEELEIARQAVSACRATT